MTDTLATTTTDPDAADTRADAGSGPSDAGRAWECVNVDPATLLLGDNVRAAVDLDRPFLASLRRYGVLEPIQATRAPDGTLTVQRGQRRTLGAVKAGLRTVPVLIVEAERTQVDRIAKQWAENERRDALTDVDRLAAVEQLTILGLPAGAIATRLGTPRKVVDAAVAANSSPVAKTAAAAHTLTLTDAALVAEFADDEHVVTEILAAVHRGSSTEHVAQRARDERARQQARHAAAQALHEGNVTVIDPPDYSDKRITPVRNLRLLTPDGTPTATPPTVDEHATCPGHAAYVTVDSWARPPQAHPTYVCTNPAAHGHAVSTYRGVTAPGSTGGGMSEEAKAERRRVVANNKAWDSAQQVRRAWLAQAFLTRTTPPKNAEAFLAVAVVHGERTEDYHRLYASLTGQEVSTYGSVLRERLAARAASGTTRQAVMLALALLVSEWESSTSRDTWRRPTERDRRYLRALLDWGYQPSDVEQLVLATDAASGEPGPTSESRAGDDEAPSPRPGDLSDEHADPSRSGEPRRDESRPQDPALRDAP